MQFVALLAQVSLYWNAVMRIGGIIIILLLND